MVHVVQVALWAMVRVEQTIGFHKMEISPVDAAD